MKLSIDCLDFTRSNERATYRTHEVEVVKVSPSVDQFEFFSREEFPRPDGRRRFFVGARRVFPFGLGAIDGVQRFRVEVDQL